MGMINIVNGPDDIQAKVVERILKVKRKICDQRVQEILEEWLGYAYVALRLFFWVIVSIENFKIVMNTELRRNA